MRSPLLSLALAGDLNLLLATYAFVELLPASPKNHPAEISLSG